LLSNAIKFTASGEVKLECHCTAGVLKVSVIDSGIGIAASRLESIFRAYEQADGTTTRQYGGTGLGLSIVSQLVALMDGRMAVASTPGSGSTFTVEIPESQGAHACTEDAGQHYLAGLRVLVVDDDEVNRMVLEAMLSRLGCISTLAASGREALQSMDAHDYDIVLTDIGMEEMDGRQLALEIARRKGSARPKIIAVTAHALRSEIEHLLEGAMDDHLAKPLTSKKLEEALVAVRLRSADPA
jgi:CheY-like chemotaxis protein